MAKTAIAGALALLFAGMPVAVSGAAAVAPVVVPGRDTTRDMTKETYDLYDAMIAAARASHYAEALSLARAADAIPGKPANVTQLFHENIVSYAIEAKDYAAALAELDKMIASGEGNKTAHIQVALDIALAHAKAKAPAYQAMLDAVK